MPVPKVLEISPHWSSWGLKAREVGVDGKNRTQREGTGKGRRKERSAPSSESACPSPRDGRPIESKERADSLRFELEQVFHFFLLSSVCTDSLGLY